MTPDYFFDPDFGSIPEERRLRIHAHWDEDELSEEPWSWADTIETAGVIEDGITRTFN